MTRENALILLRKYISNEKLIYHCFATEAVMKALSHHFNADEKQWALAGLLHDLDVEITNANLKTHGLETEKILSYHGVDKEIIDAIKLHNEHAHNLKRSTIFHHALAAGETITGLIFATTLVYPDKKIASVKAKSVVKRMKEKAFAASVNRDIIMECEIIGLPLQEFTEICLNAMKEIANDIGL
ncbi:MAG: HDIG domain-containing protein [Bacteroidales bacterium]|nr:HDIG domain-containing protein [Bacteroidales bacterium]